MDMMEAATRVIEAALARGSAGGGSSNPGYAVARDALHKSDGTAVEFGNRLGLMWGAAFQAMLKEANK